MCQAVIAAGKAKDRVGIDGVILMTALVAGWSPGSKAQMKYVKEILRSNISASRLVIYGKY